MSKDEPEMTAQDVIAFLRLLQAHGIPVVIDGGWAVEALVASGPQGFQPTRRHADLDIAVRIGDAARIRGLLAGRGYSEVPLDDSCECNFVLGDDEGHRIDVHSYAFDDEGNFIRGVPYPFESLGGHGSIAGFPVRCIAPEWLVKFHSGYAVDENDYRDVKALCGRFGLVLPEEYRSFIDTGGA
jgi:lincosamide nucleotidyltransferase A/C/D/E